MTNPGANRASKYVVTAQPKITVPATRTSILPYLERGWLAQPKIDGWNIQVHISPSGRVLSFTRNQNLLTSGLPQPIKEQLRQYFQGKVGWTVLDGEWVKSRREYYIFDAIVKDGDNQGNLNYEQRMHGVPDLKGPVFRIKQVLDIDNALSILHTQDPLVEGLVLKDPHAVGFHHQSMRRCRKDGHRHSHRLHSKE